jgi:hypothetical protein
MRFYYYKERAMLVLDGLKIVSSLEFVRILCPWIWADTKDESRRAWKLFWKLAFK